MHLKLQSIWEEFLFLANYSPHTSHKTLQFFSFVFFGPSLALTYFMDNLEETLLTCGSYFPGCQWNFHNLEITYQAVIFFQFFIYIFIKKLLCFSYTSCMERKISKKLPKKSCWNKKENKINWKNKIHWRANKIKSYTTSFVPYFCIIRINSGDFL